MRLIDAYALMDKWLNQHDPTFKCNEMESFFEDMCSDWIDLIKNAPTVDATKVVRCKDCRYFKKIAERSDSGLCHRDIVASAWKENGYCSRGERREESEVEECRQITEK